MTKGLLAPSKTRLSCSHFRGSAVWARHGHARSWLQISQGRHRGVGRSECASGDFGNQSAGRITRETFRPAVEGSGPPPLPAIRPGPALLLGAPPVVSSPVRSLFLAGRGFVHVSSQPPLLEKVLVLKVYVTGSGLLGLSRVLFLF